MDDCISNNRKFYFSLLNVMGCIGVLFLHCNNVVWTFPTGSLWVSGNLIETLFYWPVPVFYMLTGATLLDYRERYSTKDYIYKRIEKALIPFLFWSLIALLYCFMLKRPPADELNFASVISNIFCTKYVSIYWFFIPLFAIYLSIPVISLVEDKMKIFPYCIGIGLIFCGLLPFVCKLLGIVYNGTMTPPVVAGYMIYVFLGYYLSHAEFSKKQRVIIYLLGVAGWATRFFANLFLVSADHQLMNVFGGYTNFPAILQGAAVFLFIRYVDFSKLIAKRTKFAAFVDSLSGLSFGIYLCHIYLVEQLPGLLGFDRASIVWRLLGPLAVYAVCAAAVWLLKKIPVLKTFVP